MGGWIRQWRVIASSGFLCCGLAVAAATAAEAANYAKICELQSSPPVSLEYDTATGQFTLLDKDASREGEVFDRRMKDITLIGNTERQEKRVVTVGNHFLGGSRTFLRANAKKSNHEQRLLKSESNSQTTPSSSKQKYIARSCPCDESGRTYCLLDGLSSGTAVPDSCGVPWSNNLFTFSSDDKTNSSSVPRIKYNSTFNTLDIGCFELNGQTVFIRNAWPVVVLWYSALLIFLLATSNGKFARAYVVNQCFPRFSINDRQVDRIIERESEMRNELREAATRAANVAEGPGRFLVRTRGVRIPSRGPIRRAGMTEEEEQQEATRWWIEQAQQLGILSGARQGPQRVEYVLRTKTFNAKKERAKREHMRAMNSEAKGIGSNSANDNDAQEGTPGSMPSIPETGEGGNGQTDEGISNPETATTTLTIDPAAANDAPLAGTEDEDAFECTICLMEISDGEQVGVLPCMHVFHVDCLKEWITRKNACPLCQVTEIASPRPVEGDADSSPSSSEDLSSEGNSPRIEGDRNETANSEPDAGRSHVRPRFAPSFFFSTSDTEQRPTTQSRMSLSPPSSSSGSARSPVSDDDNRRRRRRRDRRSNSY